MLLLRNKDQW